VANKIDLSEASTERIKSVFPQHQVVPISALQGENVEDLYQAMVNHF
jgi:50S ribosomal subunit-associated GTPase HflX